MMKPRNRDEWRQRAQAIISANRQLNLPKRCETGDVGGVGECLHCEADQGEHCKDSR